ncbi:MAG: tubulin-like doman-containing protein [Propionicimonas sp.]
MLRPFLLIGIGGSGGKTLRVVREDLVRRMAQLGWTGDLPQAWQFLHIDVPTHADGNDPDLPAQLPLRQYQGLVAPGLTYRTIDSALAGVGRTAMGDAMGGWRPDPNKVNVPVDKGAGQFRTLGRMITIAGLDRIQDSLAAARRALTGAEVVGELQRATRLVGGDTLPTTPAPVVVVVSSIAGGSGAGAVIDVCDAVRSLGDSWASESVGFLYAPDVFDYLPEEQRKGVRPNALASLSEILSGYWNTSGASEETATLLSQQGVQLGAANRLGPRYPFLVGNRNEHVAFGTQNDIYRAMGRSIAAWVASPGLQDRMVGYTQGNWSQAAGVTDNLPLRSTGTETPFSALGSSRVGLGRDRFQDYASEALAHETVELALRRHEKLRLPNDDRIPRKLVADVANTRFGSFLVQSGLDERGEDKNDIINALRAPSFEEAKDKLRLAVTSKISTEIPARGLSPQQVRQRIVSELQAREGTFQDEQQLGRQEQARGWVIRIQELLTRRAALSVAIDGAPVTVELLGKLATELGQVRDELRGEAARLRRWAAGIEQEVATILERGGAELLLATTPTVALGVRRGVEVLEWDAESQVRELAAALIPDLVDNVVEPLALAIRHAAAALTQEEVAHVGGRPSDIAMWPSEDRVPQRLLPAANEFLLEAPSEYPQLLSTLVQRTVSAQDAGGARRESVMQILLGTDDFESGPQQMVSRTTDWVPLDHNLHTGTAATPTRAAFDVALSGNDLLSRAQTWVTQPGTPMGTFTAQGLKNYLDPAAADPEEHANRLNRFEGQFIAALNAAAPLVSINTGVLVQVHGEHAAPSNTFFTEIPLPANSPGRELVKRVLQGKGTWSNDVEKILGDGDASSIDIFSVLGTPYEPVVFDSLMRPIASEWGAKNKTPDMRSEFWRWRRARPLTEFLPMSPAIRKAMIRGWFTAGLLGQLEIDDAPATVFVPSETGGAGSSRPFPNPLLAPDTPQAHQFLPVVLTSILLAMVAVNTQSSLEPLKPYARLRDLGRSGRGGEFDTYESPAAELEEWILAGTVLAGAPTPPMSSGTTVDDWEKRQMMVEQRLEELQASYTELFLTVERRKDVFDVPGAYELRSDIAEAFGDLLRVVRGLEPVSAKVRFN